jgi:hypothetical protein
VDQRLNQNLISKLIKQNYLIIQKFLATKLADLVSKSNGQHHKQS